MVSVAFFLRQLTIKIALIEIRLASYGYNPLHFVHAMSQ